MTAKENYSLFKGRIRTFRACNGGLTPFVEKNNIVVYQAADILAQMMAGNTTYRPTHIGFLYAPTAAVIPDPTTATPPREHTIDDIASDLQAVTGNMVISALARNVSVSVDGDAALYEGNKVSLYAISDSTGTPVFTGAEYAGAPTPGADSYKQVALLTQIISAGSPTPVYKLFARSALSVGFDVVAGFELAAFWDISFF